MPNYMDDAGGPRLRDAKDRAGNFNHLGYTDILPEGDLGPHAAFEGERIAALRRDSLMQGAGNVLQQGLQSVSSYRPGGLAAATSPFYSQMAGNLQTQASMTQAPSEALMFWWKQDEARRQRRRDQNRYWTGVAVNAAMMVGSAAIGSVMAPPGMPQKGPGSPGGNPIGQDQQFFSQGGGYGQAAQNPNSQFFNPNTQPGGPIMPQQGGQPGGGGQNMMSQTGDGGPGGMGNDQKTIDDGGKGGAGNPPPMENNGNTAQGPGGMGGGDPMGGMGGGMGAFDGPMTAGLGMGTNSYAMANGMDTAAWDTMAIQSDPTLIAEIQQANDMMEFGITQLERARLV